MEIKPVATYHCDLDGKFGLPRQAGLTPSLCGVVVLEPEFAREEALRGLEDFDFIHLIWGFSLNSRDDSSLTVRPPRLGGNRRVGVFASRSPFRPNGLGLSSVRIESIDFSNCRITVSGADLADGTPIYDIKPYVEYSDSHSGVRCGFVDSNEWKELKVNFSKEAETRLSSTLDAKQLDALIELLKQDPRPQYHKDPERIYGLVYCGLDLHFRVCNGELELL